ncbi:MAG: amidohydrolase family protein, partial [Thermotogaceae bacterium]|nr:amidohydrolase family protein [Thermotogaceae bacterium]
EQKMVPTTRMGIMAELRSIFIKAKDYMKNEKRKFDPKREALIPVIEKKVPLRVHVHTARDITTFLNFAEEFDLNVIFDHATEAHLVKEKLLNVPIVYGPIVFSRRGTELKNLNSSNLKYMKGLLFSLTTDHPTIPIQYLDLLAGLSIGEGFSEKEALSLITINAAKILGMDDRIGSVEPGKDADIVIASDHPLKVSSRIEKVLIDGKIILSN